MAIFRYPGGKSKLLKRIRPQIDFVIRHGAKTYHEPCVGGGAIALSVAKDYPEIPIHLNDADPEMHAFWELVVDGSAGDIERLFELIRQTPSVALFKQMRRLVPQNKIEMAYQAVFFNRTSFSGIRGAGPQGGYAQTGRYRITDRYRPERIIRDIERARVLLQGRTTVSHCSVIDHMQSMIGDNDISYIDPPYFRVGNMLYPTGMTHQEHDALAMVLRTKGNWILSYDRCQPIAELYDFACRLLLPVRYSITDHGTRRGTQFEYLILPPGMPRSKECAAMAMEQEWGDKVDEMAA